MQNLEHKCVLQESYKNYAYTMHPVWVLMASTYTAWL